jgi:hypothetical protein
VKKETEMKLFRTLCGSIRNSSNSRQKPAADLYPLGKPACRDWRKERLAAAASRYGRPFKCANEDLPREVLVGGRELITVGGGEKPASRKPAETSGARRIVRGHAHLMLMQGS